MPKWARDWTLIIIVVGVVGGLVIPATGGHNGRAYDHDRCLETTEHNTWQYHECMERAGHARLP